MRCDMRHTGLYIHIPFCVKKCDYCDFLSFGHVAQETKDAYVDALCKELTSLGNELNQPDLSTVYIGGGTPSALSGDQIIRIISVVKDTFVLASDAEITMEMNPGTVADSNLKGYISAGINRVSMGLQSDDDEQLVKLGRVHTFEAYVQTYNRIREAGINNVNIDVMFGLHKQTMAEWQHTLETVIDLAPEHISAYSLIIEPGTVYDEAYDKGMLDLPNEELEREMYWYAHQRLEEAGYKHYEISNYSKPGMASIHNSKYWDLSSYIGAGLGASSYYGQVRYKNITGLKAYIEANGYLADIRTVEQINDHLIELEESFFLGLRLLDGIDLVCLKEAYGDEAVGRYADIIDELVESSMLIREGSIIRLSREGLNISNQIMSHFLLDD